MATMQSVMADLESKGSEKMRAMYVRHGMAAGNALGVSVADLKTIAKTIKRQQALALELYDTHILDAMYLAGMVANGAQMTAKQLQSWADATSGMQMISEYTVPWVTVENAAGREMAMKWIVSKKEHVATSGWCTYSGLIATTPDEALDAGEIEELLETVVRGIGAAPNRVKYVMNGFVISVGSYMKPLAALARSTAEKLGKVSVDVGDTDCKVPLASEYIAKVEAMGRQGKRKKSIRC